MLKQLFDFILTGISVILTYALYCIFSFITVFVLGVPIGFAIRIIVDAVNMLYNWII